MTILHPILTQLLLVGIGSALVEATPPPLYNFTDLMILVRQPPDRILFNRYLFEVLREAQTHPYYPKFEEEMKAGAAPYAEFFALVNVFERKPELDHDSNHLNEEPEPILDVKVKRSTEQFPLSDPLNNTCINGRFPKCEGYIFVPFDIMDLQLITFMKWPITRNQKLFSIKDRINMTTFIDALVPEDLLITPSMAVFNGETLSQAGMFTMFNQSFNSSVKVADFTNVSLEETELPIGPKICKMVEIPPYKPDPIIDAVLWITMPILMIFISLTKETPEPKYEQVCSRSNYSFVDVYNLYLRDKATPLFLEEFRQLEKDVIVALNKPNDIFLILREIEFQKLNDTTSSNEISSRVRRGSNPRIQSGMQKNVRKPTPVIVPTLNPKNKPIVITKNTKIPQDRRQTQEVQQNYLRHQAQARNARIVPAGQQRLRGETIVPMANFNHRARERRSTSEIGTDDLDFEYVTDEEFLDYIDVEQEHLYCIPESEFENASGILLTRERTGKSVGSAMRAFLRAIFGKNWGKWIRTERLTAWVNTKLGRNVAQAGVQRTNSITQAITKHSRRIHSRFTNKAQSSPDLNNNMIFNSNNLQAKAGVKAGSTSSLPSSYKVDLSMVRRSTSGLNKIYSGGSRSSLATTVTKASKGAVRRQWAKTAAKKVGKGILTIMGYTLLQYAVGELIDKAKRDAQNDPELFEALNNGTLYTEDAVKELYEKIDSLNDRIANVSLENYRLNEKAVGIKQKSAFARYLDLYILANHTVIDIFPHDVNVLSKIVRRVPNIFVQPAQDTWNQVRGQPLDGDEVYVMDNLYALLFKSAMTMAQYVLPYEVKEVYKLEGKVQDASYRGPNKPFVEKTTKKPQGYRPPVTDY